MTPPQANASHSQLPIQFGPQACGSLAESASREWLVADGLGGFAMGTVAGLRTRRYHGLLVSGGASGGRQLGLASLDPVLVLPSGARVPLGVHEWSTGAVSPTGHQLLESFDLTDGLPRWRWRIGDVVIERTLAMVHGRSAVGIVHRLITGAPVRLELEALCTWRDVHGERHAYGDLATEQVGGGVVVEGSYRLKGPGWQPGGSWYFGVHARAEADRGLSPNEDLWYAGRFVADLEPGSAAEVMEVVAWAGDLTTDPEPAVEIVAAARARASALITTARPRDDVEATLVLAADTFVVTGPEVIAGYPWFGAWSRDTMTSYEGLFLDTGRIDEGRQLLVRYAGTLSEGMLANTADTGSTEYNTADATLWFMHAVGRHVSRTGDLDLAAELADPLERVVEAHIAGTRYGIGIDPGDGLLTQGQHGYALTWMDARVDGVGITPRIGKAVELNALWISGLAALRFMADKLGRDAASIAGLEERARTSFAARFVSPAGWLYDVVDGPDGDDATLRPNQLLAFSLPDAPMRDAEIVRVVGSALLTPLGLRSLAPSSRGYRPVHRGGPSERDSAYHEGTVWPWLIGPYVDAVVTSANGAAIGAAIGAATALAGVSAAGGPRRLDDVRGVLEGLTGHLRDWGLGSVSETADGDPPHAGTGCPFQAWSVAEFLRSKCLLDS